MKEREAELQSANYTSQEALSVISASYAYERNQYDTLIASMDAVVSALVTFIGESPNRTPLDASHAADRAVFLQDMFKRLESVGFLESLMEAVKIDAGSHPIDLLNSKVNEELNTELENFSEKNFGALPAIFKPAEIQPITVDGPVRPWGPKVECASITRKK